MFKITNKNIEERVITKIVKEINGLEIIEISDFYKITKNEFGYWIEISCFIGTKDEFKDDYEIVEEYENNEDEYRFFLAKDFQFHKTDILFKVNKLLEKNGELDYD